MPDLMCIITRLSVNTNDNHKRFYCIVPNVLTAAAVVCHLNDIQTEWKYSWEYIDYFNTLQDFRYYESL